MVKEPWDATNRAISMILNAWPVLYAAASRGRGEELASPEPTDVEQEMNGKDAKSVKGLKTTQDLQWLGLRQLARGRLGAGEHGGRLVLGAAATAASASAAAARVGDHRRVGDDRRRVGVDGRDPDLGRRVGLRRGDLSSRRLPRSAAVTV